MLNRLKTGSAAAEEELEGFEAVCISKEELTRVGTIRDLTKGADDVVDAPEDSFGFGESSLNLLEEKNSATKSVERAFGAQSTELGHFPDEGFRSHKASANNSSSGSILRDMEIVIDPKARMSTIRCHDYNASTLICQLTFLFFRRSSQRRSMLRTFDGLRGSMASTAEWEGDDEEEEDGEGEAPAKPSLVSPSSNSLTGKSKGGRRSIYQRKSVLPGVNSMPDFKAVKASMGHAQNNQSNLLIAKNAEVEDIRIDGWLTKRGHLHKNWKARCV
jgi:hypothetical protein